MRRSPYLIESNSTGSRFEPIPASEQHYDEKWLQELLRCHPDILPTAEVEPVYSPLISIGREVGTSVGSIDNLFISKSGYLVLVETKLWRNPQSRREVVAQAIDYGASISKWTYEELNSSVRKYTKAYEKSECDLTEWIEQNFGPIEGGKEYYEELVGNNLRLGRYLTIIVGDHIQKSLKDLLSQVNKYPHLAMEVALIELGCYRWQAKADWPLLVVPDLVTQTEIVERSVVQVTLIEPGKYTVEAVQEKAPSEKTGRRRVFLTEDAYWNLYKERSPESYQKAYDLIEKYRQMEGITIDTTEGSIVVRLDIQESGEQATLFFIENFRYLASWPDTIRHQIERAGFPVNLVDEYKSVMSKILKRSGKLKLAKPLVEVNSSEFDLAVENFIQLIQSAEPISD